ncbi:2-dehydro-3-deoxygalactonokinase [Parasulfitobacter algicola]|uniref:2-dehydro-3-deoxygalactonokinase n=1 Tax=Parasulfitobacter algicola TaxID=2614809 RepID=A0ABX2IQ26_9RHOB|nr:2-dehydro-3-deoxygalactonokinase [Sulfitobacter algicola]NSX54116.1 2-dehydro-3-deoxygalactonokinase [Sulfitobacter algicola]
MSQDKSYPDWFAVDWGTSNLRVWAMTASGTVLDQAVSDQGMGKLTRDRFEPALLDLIGDWLGPNKTPVIACGMVGARQGWVEAPYQTTPCKPFVNQLTAVNFLQDPRLQVYVIPGVCQKDPADVMRGEETQIAGFLSLNKNWDGVICLPGTHTKWVQISADEIISFKTFLTGELFDLLTHHSVLRHSIDTDGWDDDAFQTAVSEAISRPEAIAARLFSIRADDLLHDRAPSQACAYLSGLLIGAELAASRPYWLGQQIAIIGGSTIAKHYADALQAQGAFATVTDAPRMTLAGLSAAYAKTKETA